MECRVLTPFPAPLFEPLQQFRAEQLAPLSAGPPRLHWPSSTQARASNPAWGGAAAARAAKMVMENAVRNVARILAILWLESWASGCFSSWELGVEAVEAGELSSFFVKSEWRH